MTKLELPPQAEAWRHAAPRSQGHIPHLKATSHPANIIPTVPRRSEPSFTFIDLFAGIGGMRIALQRAGGTCVFSSEWDKFAADTYEANFGERPQGDITEIDELAIAPHDCLVAGFPCQPFSNAGKKLGFSDTRGTLFFEIERILRHHQPSMLLLENVKGFRNHDKGRTFQVVVEVLTGLGYAVSAEVLNASDFGLPQNRERVFIVGFNTEKLGVANFSFPGPTGKPTRVGQILERGRVPSRYYLSDKLWKGHQRRLREHRAKGNGFGFSLFDRSSPRTSTISARYYKDGSEILIRTRGNPRKLTPREAARLQGFPESFTIPVSDSQAYRQFGNSVAVPVVEEIAKSMVAVFHSSWANPAA
jgi:DNA (cytosine-5)-methyltransferase 1